MRYALARNAVYRYYKGNYYRILSIAQHTETNEKLVIYQSLYGKLETWARPKNMFGEYVNDKPRFTYIGNLDD